jgi:hypothetical protein
MYENSRKNHDPVLLKCSYKGNAKAARLPVDERNVAAQCLSAEVVFTDVPNVWLKGSVWSNWQPTANTVPLRSRVRTRLFRQNCTGKHGVGRRNTRTTNVSWRLGYCVKRQSRRCTRYPPPDATVGSRSASYDQREGFSWHSPRPVLRIGQEAVIDRGHVYLGEIVLWEA